MARKEKYIRLRDDGRWELRMQYGHNADGSAAKLQEYFHSRDEARARRDYLLQQRQQGKEPQLTRITLDDWCQESLRVTRKSLQDTTVTGYRAIINNHITGTPIGRMRLEDIRIGAVQAWVDDMQDSTPKTIRNCLAFFSRVWKHACRRYDQLPVIDTSVIDIPLGSSRDRAQMTPEQCGQLLAASHGQLHTIVMLAAVTGLRQSELLGLCWDSVDMATGRYEVRRKLVRDAETGALKLSDNLKTRNAYRAGILPAPALEELRKHRIRQKEESLRCGELWQNHGNIFYGLCGDFARRNTVSKALYALEDKLGIPRVGMHGQRHMYATSLITQGVDDITIAASMGHSSAAFTRRQYADIYADYTTKANAAAENLLAQIGSKLGQEKAK